jgi:hypothetical protein
MPRARDQVALGRLSGHLLGNGENYWVATAEGALRRIYGNSKAIRGGALARQAEPCLYVGMSRVTRCYDMVERCSFGRQVTSSLEDSTRKRPWKTVTPL